MGEPNGNQKKRRKRKGFFHSKNLSPPMDLESLNSDSFKGLCLAEFDMEEFRVFTPKDDFGSIRT